MVPFQTQNEKNTQCTSTFVISSFPNARALFHFVNNEASRFLGPTGLGFGLRSGARGRGEDPVDPPLVPPLSFIIW